MDTGYEPLCFEQSTTSDLLTPFQPTLKRILRVIPLAPAVPKTRRRRGYVIKNKTPSFGTGLLFTELLRTKEELRIIEERDAKKLSDEEDKLMEDEHKRLNTVVHPWHLPTVVHKRISPYQVIIDDDQKGTNVYDIARTANNLRGTGLYRVTTPLDSPPVPLPEDWSYKPYVVEACKLCVPFAIAKKDWDLRTLTPMALVHLKKFVTPWPNAELHIREFLITDEFAQLVDDHCNWKVHNAQNVLTSKAKNLGADLVASPEEITAALDLYRLGIWRTIQYMCYHVLASVCLILMSYGAYTIRHKYHEDTLTSNVIMVSLTLFGIICLGLLFSYMYMPSSKTARILLALQTETIKVQYASVVNILSSCSKGLLLPNLCTAWRCSINPGEQDKLCPEKKPYDVYGLFIKGANMVIPKGCHHDQYTGLMIRFLFERTLDLNAIASAIVAGENLCRQVVGRWTHYSYDDWVTHLPGRRRRLLVEEPTLVWILDQVPVDLFVKLEAYLGKCYKKFKPRIIQGRRLGYQNILGAFFYGVSKWLGTVFDKHHKLTYDSGLDALELGFIVDAIYAEYKYVYEIDVSNWDGSLAPQWLLFEIWFIENCLPHLPPRWKEIKKYWRRVEGFGKNGVRFKTTHGRRSGDMWTSCFNSLINLVILFWIFNGDVRAVAKGDDNFFGTNTYMSVDQIIARYASIGMVAKVKLRANKYDLEYCSGHFWPTDDGLKWGVKPFRILSKLGLNLGRHQPKVHKQLLYGTALSMLPIAGHVPLIGTILRTIVNESIANDVKPILADEPWKTSSCVINDIHHSSYSIMETRYGLTISDLELMEMTMMSNVNECRKLTLSDFPLVIDDRRFLHGFRYDTDADPSDNANIIFPDPAPVPQCKSVDFTFVLVCLVTPIVEEGARYLFGMSFSILIATLEGLYHQNFLPVVVHGFLHLALTFNIFLAMLLHGMFNYFVYRIGGRNGLIYGSTCDLLIDCLWRTLPLRRAEIFISMPKRVALSKYRLLGFLSNCVPFLPRRYAGHIKVKKTQSKPQRKGKKSAQRSHPKKGKSSLGRQLLKGGLGALGSLFGPAGAGVGGAIGDFGANLLGMGDYQEQKVHYNTVYDGQGVPSVHKTDRGVRISHKEFLGDITGSVDFESRSFRIQPGSSVTFPWLSNIAQMFQSYRLHGCVFDFVSTSADALNSVNTALGTVIMGTQYNVGMPEFVNKAEMEQYEYSVSGRPSKSLLHCIECDPKFQVMSHMFTRTGTLPEGQDYQLYDWGNFQLATVGMQAEATIGELWVAYDIEFYKPRTPSGGAWPGDFTRIRNGPYGLGTDWFGTIQTAPVGNLGITITSTSLGWDTIHFPSVISAGRYLIVMYWRGNTNAEVVNPTAVLSNLTFSSSFSLDTLSFVNAPSSLQNTGRASSILMVTVDGYNKLGSSIQLVGFSPPGTPVSVDIQVICVPLSDDAF